MSYNLSRPSLLGMDPAAEAWELIRCPVCQSAGNLTASSWRCLSCARTYPVYSRIIDFRIGGNREDLSFAHADAVRSETERVNRALSIASHVSYTEMVNTYFREFPTHPDIERGEKGTLMRADEMAQEVFFQMSQTVPFPEIASRQASVALDLGCGAAGLAALLARHFSLVIAMDADLDRMVLAERHCADLGLNNVIFLCAFGESTPLVGDAVDFASCVEILEHASSQGTLVAELRRILRPGGALYLTTPNRFSAGREPHVNLWALGWLPRGMMDSYVRFRLGVPYAGKRNLSYWELCKLMRASFESNFSFVRPRRSHYTPQARVANFFLRVPGLASAARCLVAGYHVCARKPVRSSEETRFAS